MIYHGGIALKLRRGAVALAVAAALALASCGTAETPIPSKPAAPLAGTFCTLVEANEKAPSAGLPGEHEPHIRLDDAIMRVSGYTGVNSLVGGYQTSGATLAFSQLATTRRAGPPPAMELESSVLHALEATRAYRIAGETLELYDAGGRPVARFRAKPAS